MKELIRVLHVVGGMRQGGTENFLMNLYRNIDRKKVQFDFLVNRKGFFDEEIEKLGGKIYYIPALQKVGQIKYTKNLDKFFQEHKEYKIVHSHINQVSGLILERAKKAGILIRIAHIHSNKYAGNFIENLYKKYLKTKIKNNANYKFACSKDAGNFLFGKEDEFLIVHNSIDINKYTFNYKIRERVRRDFDIDKNCFVIGNVGRFVESKNHLFLLKVFNEYLNLSDKSKLMLIGKGSEKENILKYIRMNNLETKVIMLEDRKDVNELMQAMDFFVFPSKAEGLGIVLIEAQATGLKCIASANVIPKEARVTDLLEFYSLENRPKQWAEEIYKQKEYKRENTYEEIRKNGYNIKETTQYLEDFYIKVGK